MSEMHEIQLGERARARGWVTEADLARAARIQETVAREGLHLRLGEVLVRLGLLSANQIRQILREQGVEIAWCAHCFALFNVRPVQIAPGAPCPTCANPLTVPKTLPSVEVGGTVSLRTDEDPEIHELEDPDAGAPDAPAPAE